MCGFDFNGIKLNYENADWRICVVCKKYSYGELFGGVHVCYKCVFPPKN